MKRRGFLKLGIGATGAAVVGGSVAAKEKLPTAKLSVTIGDFVDNGDCTYSHSEAMGTFDLSSDEINAIISELSEIIL